MVENLFGMDNPLWYNHCLFVFHGHCDFTSLSRILHMEHTPTVSMIRSSRYPQSSMSLKLKVLLKVQLNYGHWRDMSRVKKKRQKLEDYSLDTITLMAFERIFETGCSKSHGVVVDVQQKVRFVP